MSHVVRQPPQSVFIVPMLEGAAVHTAVAAERLAAEMSDVVG